MDQKLLLLIAGVAVYITLLGILTGDSGENGRLNLDFLKINNNQQSTQNQNEFFVTISDVKIPVEIAKTRKQREKGLSNRDALEENSGMLFVLEENSTPAFWMKDTKIPIDIIWIDDNKVTQITENIAPPNAATADRDLKMYLPNNPVDYVLEVNAGFAQKNGIEVGSEVVIPENIWVSSR